MRALQLWLLLVHTSIALSDTPCDQRNFPGESFVCVCSSTFCDEFEPLTPLPAGQLLHVASDKDSQRFASQVLNFVNNAIDDNDDDDHVSDDHDDDEEEGEERLILSVDRRQRFQEVLGWGGAFTDAAGINIASLSEGAQENLLRSYYSSSGLDYNIGRINMGGCDFSTRTYTYVDTPGDVNLDTFELQEEDLQYKIPFIRRSQSLSDRTLKLFGSPWTAPPWMKTNNDYVGRGFLREEYYQPYAEYFLKFIQSYESEGVPIWGVTAQNEPMDGRIPNFSFNCMGWDAQGQRIFVGQNLGPTLEAAGYRNVKIMIFDDQRPLAPLWVPQVLNDPDADKYVSGVAMHWYLDELFPLPGAMDVVHNNFPDKFILYTEACTGADGSLAGSGGSTVVVLGSWERGERYLHNILQDFNHWAVGWTDWNLALDLQGGPNWESNFVDSPVIVNAEVDEFYKQPMYYALGHVTRFIPEGSVRIGLNLEQGQDDIRLTYSAAERPDGAIAFIVMNRGSDVTERITLIDPDRGYVDIDIPPKSMHSFVYW